jgi:hypothetical protein
MKRQWLLLYLVGAIGGAAYGGIPWPTCVRGALRKSSVRNAAASALTGGIRTDRCL